MVNLEYKTGASSTEFQYHPLPPDQSGVQKRSYESLNGPGSYDHTYNSFQDLTPRHERTQHDAPLHEDPSDEVFRLIESDQPGPVNMNATVVHESLIKTYGLLGYYTGLKLIVLQILRAHPSSATHSTTYS